MEVTLREAVPADAKEILAYLVKVDGQSDFLVLDDLDLTPEAYGDLLAYCFESKRHLMMLALADDKIIGMLNVNGSPEERRVHVGEIGISVDHDYWRNGIASLLLEELDAWWRNESTLVRLELYVMANNIPAITLYLKNNFEIEGQMHQAVLMPDDTLADLIVMGQVR